MQTQIRFRKEQGKLVACSAKDKASYTHFINTIPEGQDVEAFFSANGEGHTLGQLNAVHKIIREVAALTGHSFDDMKLYVKKKIGLYTPVMVDDEEYYEWGSFADCSYNELTLAIQEAEQLLVRAEQKPVLT